MNLSESTIQQSMQGSMSLGYVVELTDSGNALVSLEQPPASTHKFLCCFMLDAHGHTVPVQPGDKVLVLPPASYQEIGCILGRVGAYNPPDRQCVQLEATKELSLKCGEAAIKLRSDGKIVTQGVDIASLAKRAQKIRGGSVQIN